MEKNKNYKILIWAILMIILLFICLITFTDLFKKENLNDSSQIANPASVYCIDNNGTLEIRTSEDGGQYGVCKKEGKECEEWAFFRGECTLS